MNARSDDKNVIWLADAARESVRRARLAMDARQRARAREIKVRRIEIRERKPGDPVEPGRDG